MSLWLRLGFGHVGLCSWVLWLSVPSDGASRSARHCWYWISPILFPLQKPRAITNKLSSVAGIRFKFNKQRPALP